MGDGVDLLWWIEEFKRIARAEIGAKFVVEVMHLPFATFLSAIGFGGCKHLVKPFNCISKVVVLFRVVAIGGSGG